MEYIIIILSYQIDSQKRESFFKLVVTGDGENSYFKFLR